MSFVRNLLPLAALASAGLAVVTVVAWVTLGHVGGGEQEVPGVTDAQASMQGEGVSLRPLRVNSVSELERLFERRQYAWPPQGEVPPLAVQALPSGLNKVGVTRKKHLFFRALLPLVLAENAAVARKRAFLKSAFGDGELPAEGARRRRVDAIAERYQVDGDLNKPAVRRRLLQRVDVVPPGLVLAQAANESAWGTSRFSREGNNLFGQWTYDADKGLVPRRRREGADHYVRVFSGPRESVRAYLLNLNTNAAYSAFREMRAYLRESGQALDPVVLAGGLEAYSERGRAYVADIRQMIRHNDLGRLNGVRLAG